MRLLRRIRSVELAVGCEIPRWYGFVRGMHYSDDAYIAPIPLNFIYAAWHWFYWRVLVVGLGHRSDYISRLRQYWIEEGEARGYRRGYETGIQHHKVLEMEQPR